MPLLGLGQAFAGPYGDTRYELGLTSAQMKTQAQVFCKAGATSVGWYGWDDSGFGSGTATPMTSVQIQQGVKMVLQHAKVCGIKNRNDLDSMARQISLLPLQLGYAEPECTHAYEVQSALSQFAA